jgi:hypothetical protein
MGFFYRADGSALHVVDSGEAGRSGLIVDPNGRGAPGALAFSASAFPWCAVR